jgi:hypothetical protein
MLPGQKQTPKAEHQNVNMTHHVRQSIATATESVF